MAFLRLKITFPMTQSDEIGKEVNLARRGEERRGRKDDAIGMLMEMEVRHTWIGFI